MPGPLPAWGAYAISLFAIRHSALGRSDHDCQIFSGLALSLTFGLLASTIFTLFVIPIAYWLLYAGKPGHGATSPEA